MNRHCLIYLFLIVNIGSAFGQKLEAKSSHTTIFVGEPIVITYKVFTKKSDSILYKPYTDEIKSLQKDPKGTLMTEGANFEITQSFKDTLFQNEKIKEWRGNYVVTVWDSGTFIIPGSDIIINDSTYNFGNLVIQANLMDAQHGVDLYDIRENFADIPSEPFSMKSFIMKNWWWLTLIVISIIAFIVFRRRRKEDEVISNISISLKDRTLIAIEALEKERKWEKGELKFHFVELSYILRSYLTARYDVSLLERTTEQTKLILGHHGLNDDTIAIIVRILSHSDLVKFAKSTPEPIEILKISALAKQVVAETSPLQFDNVE